MAVKSASKTPLTPAEIWRNKKLGRVHILKKQCEALPGFSYDDQLWQAGKVTSAADLDKGGLLRLIAQLEAIAPPQAASRTSHGKRPRNMEKGGSRADQLGKIEALLTVGKLSWRYADSIAKQMRLADMVAWVATEDLYKIITALRKKAQKEGWDLSGEEK